MASVFTGLDYFVELAARGVGEGGRLVLTGRVWVLGTGVSQSVFEDIGGELWAKACELWLC